MTTAIFESLQPELLWRRFGQLKDIPRPSKQEGQVMTWLRQWASELELPAYSDAVGNLCVHAPAAGGGGGSPVVIQNHVDIVASDAEQRPPDVAAAEGRIPVERCELKASGQFAPQPDGGWIRAPYTTLGADNGIGCAMAMAVAELDDITRPPLELLFTVDEEEGMSGALELDAEALRIQGRRLINLDTEDDDELTIGSAGGCNVSLRWRAPRESGSELVARQLVLADLRGGHSGVEIASGRANAIRTLARAISAAGVVMPIRIADLQGGDRHNAIPRFCRATVLIPEAKLEPLNNSLAETSEMLTRQFAGRDNAVQITVQNASPTATAFSVEDSQRLLNLLQAVPTGVFAMTAEIPELPETSNNVALISVEDELVKIECSSRSAYEPGMRDLQDAIQAAARMAGAEVTQGNGYPGWKPDLDSELLKLTRDAYQRLFHEPPKVLAVHAGLECGVLASRIPGLDCVSFGPNIRGNHAPGEHVQIASVQKSFQWLLETLKQLAGGG